MYAYHITPNKDVLTARDWQEFFEILSAGTTIGKVASLTIDFNQNITNYSIEMPTPLHAQSGSVGIFNLKESTDVLRGITTAKKRFWVSFGIDKDLHHMAQQYRHKDGQTLLRAKISVGKTVKKLDASLTLYFDKSGTVYRYKKHFSRFPFHLLAADYSASSSVNKASAPNYLRVEKTLGLMTSQRYDSLFEVDGYPYFQRSYYIPLNNFDFDRHGLVVGQSGSGKSKFLELLIRRLYALPSHDNYHVVVVDPHGTIEKDLRDFVDKSVVNFRTTATKLFSSAGDINMATELSLGLLTGLLGAVKNSRIDRLLRYSLYVLFVHGDMSFVSLRRLLDDGDYRRELIDSVRMNVPDSIIMFFDTDFLDFKTKYFLETIEPVLALVDELSLVPGITNPGNTELAHQISRQFLTIFSLSKSSMGDRAVKTIGASLMATIFQLAQANVLGKRIVLIVDEVSVVQSPILQSILSEARKFGLNIILSQQYLGQVDPEIRSAMFANIYNYICFKVSDDDARMLAANMSFEIPAEIVDRAKAHGLSADDLRRSFLTDQNTRDCLLRLYSRGIFYPVIRAKTVDINQQGA